MRTIWAVTLLFGLAACSAPTDVPQKESGVGFGSYSDYQRHLAAQEAARRAGLTPGPMISNESTAPAADSLSVASAPPSAAPPAPTVPAQQQPAPDAQASADPLPEKSPAPVPDNSPIAAETKPSFWDKPVQRPDNVPTNSYAATPNNDPSQNSTDVTDNNNFATVTAERSRQEDARRLQRNREQYVIVQPTDLPKRPGTNIPNIVSYALKTTNPLGAKLYKRGPFDTVTASERACAKYVSADLAQEAFLSAGGPQRDPKKLDPDGDGFACKWDPTPFRAVRNQG